MLRDLRNNAGLTQEELAELANLSQKAISAYERGQRTRPRPKTVRRLATALELTGPARESFVRHADSSPMDDCEHLIGTYGSDVVYDRMDVGGAERSAAWELYVELVTRTAVSRLGPHEGLLREALDSLYSLFGTVRGILRRHGPAVAQAVDGRPHTFGGLAIDILNEVLRPLLSEWHPLLLHYETQCPHGASPVEHERAWPRNDELREVLAGVRSLLDEYAQRLALVAGVPHPLNGRPTPVGHPPRG